MLDAVGMFQNLLWELDGDLGEVVEALGGVEVVADDEEIFVAALQLRNRLSFEMAGSRIFYGLLKYFIFIFTFIVIVILPMLVTHKTQNSSFRHIILNVDTEAKKVVFVWGSDCE